MRTLLTEGFRRLEGRSTQGVFKLTQAMGGGKTHNPLAFGLLAKHPDLTDLGRHAVDAARPAAEQTGPIPKPYRGVPATNEGVSHLKALQQTTVLGGSGDALLERGQRLVATLRRGARRTRSGRPFRWWYLGAQGETV